MTDERDEVSAGLSFSQRYGYEDLPEPVRLKYLSDDLRREIWNYMYRILQDIYGSLGFSEETVRFIERVWGKLLRKTEDEISTRYEVVYDNFKHLILKEKFNKVLDFLELISNEDILRVAPPEKSSLVFPRDFVNRIADLFTHHSAYRLEISSRPYYFRPCANKIQGETIKKAIQTLHEEDMAGAITHLRNAAKNIHEKEYAGAIRESIHAVESVARRISPESKTLEPALKSLQKEGLIKHPALKVAFSKLYGYTNDEQGIRHPLINKGAADVGLDEAMFMYGACASFAQFLANKNKERKNK